MANYTVITLDLSPPLISGLSPGEGDHNISLAAPLIFNLADILVGVDITTLELTIAGEQAISGGDLQPGYSGEITQVSGLYTASITRDEDWPPLTNIIYEIHVQDDLGNELVFQGSFFSTDNYTEFSGEWVNLGENGTVLKGQLQRFLKLTSFVLDEVKGVIDAFPVILNVDKTDADYLPLIAALVGIDFNYDIPIPRQREEIKRAVGIYKTKGTIPAIKRFCRNIIGFDPEIAEWPPKILMSNDPSKISARVTTPGIMDNLGLPGDNAFYSLDLSQSGNYRFDKFGIYFFLPEFAGIPKSAAKKILRLLSRNIPASTVGKIIFVDYAYSLPADSPIPANIYHAFGTGEDSWENQLPQPDPGQTQLVNEIYRRAPDSIVYLDENGLATINPTNQIRVLTILNSSEPELDGHNLREQGLFGDATTEKDSGTLIGAANHKGQWKTEGYRFRKTIELTFQ